MQQNFDIPDQTPVCVFVPHQSDSMPHSRGGGVKPSWFWLEPAWRRPQLAPTFIRPFQRSLVLPPESQFRRQLSSGLSHVNKRTLLNPFLSLCCSSVASRVAFICVLFVTGLPEAGSLQRSLCGGLFCCSPPLFPCTLSFPTLH